MAIVEGKDARRLEVAMRENQTRRVSKEEYERAMRVFRSVRVDGSQAQAATLLAESEAEDAAVERDPSHVPAQAHNEAIRKRGEGIWR